MTETAPVVQSAPAANRLSIAHLLLWTAATAVVLGFVRQVVDYYTPTSATTPQFALNLRLQYLLLFAVSPAYGTALAGISLATWQLTTRQFRFPSQPGHWLLLMIAVLALVIAADWLLRLGGLPVGVGPVLLTMVGVQAGLSIAAAIQIRRLTRWLVTFALAACGLGGIGFSVALQLLPGDGPLSVLTIVLGELTVVSSIMASLAAGILDLTAPERYDVFHWTGVATLAAVASHPLLAWLVALATVG